jgi:predicted RND superfamily exporter protein
MEADTVQNFFLFLGEKIGKRPVLTVFITILITVALISGVTRIWMATGNETFIKTNTDIYKNNLQLEEMFGGESIVIRFKAANIHDLLTAENMMPLDQLERALLENDHVYSVIGLTTTLRHMTEKQAETMQENSNMMVPGIATNQDTLDMLLYDDGELRPMFTQMVIDKQNAVMMIRLTGNASDGQVEEVVHLIADFVEKNPLENTVTTITGKPVLDIALRTEMRSSMQKMVLSALILMIVIVSVVFKVRWRLLPLAINFGAVVATMGLMGHIGIPMTMVSMAAFPILIGLGIDYSIQFHNRYEEEFMSEEAARHEV